MGDLDKQIQPGKHRLCTSGSERANVSSTRFVNRNIHFRIATSTTINQRRRESSLFKRRGCVSTISVSICVPIAHQRSVVRYVERDTIRPFTIHEQFLKGLSLCSLPACPPKTRNEDPASDRSHRTQGPCWRGAYRSSSAGSWVGSLLYHGVPGVVLMTSMAESFCRRRWPGRWRLRILQGKNYTRDPD